MIVLVLSGIVMVIEVVQYQREVPSVDGGSGIIEAGGLVGHVQCSSSWSYSSW